MKLFLKNSPVLYPEVGKKGVIRVNLKDIIKGSKVNNRPLNILTGTIPKKIKDLNKSGQLLYNISILVTKVPRGTSYSL